MRGRFMRKWIVGGVVALLLAFGVWYFASPALALNGLKQAARDGDAAELRERVDFPALRDSLKTQLRARMAAEVARSDDSNPFGKLGAMIAMGMVDSAVEGFVTPESISAMVLQQKRDAATKRTPVPAQPKRQDKDPDWTVRREGLSTFRLVAKNQGKDAPELLFERDGLGWKLVAVDMKAQSLGPTG
jgi:hypothetical protein